MPMFPGYWFNFRQASIESIRIRKLVFSFYCIFVKKNHSAEYPCSVNNANNCLRTCRTHLVLVIFTILFEWSQIFWPLMWIFLTNNEFLTQLCLQFIVIVYVLQCIYKLYLLFWIKKFNFIEISLVYDSLTHFRI